jgi:peptidylprolyl isomerase
MARSQHPDSANSQFFITFGDAQFLNNNYTVFGRVVEGMAAVDQIKKAPKGRQSGMVDDPDKILSLKVQADGQ